jgi:hypothetical protein
MLGDNSVRLESKALKCVKDALKLRTCKLNVDLSIYNDSIQNLVQLNHHQPLSEAKAARSALQLVTSQFNKELIQTNFERRYLNYGSSNYSATYDNMFFASVYFEAATYYGERLVVIKESLKQPRGLDLNYYNWINFGRWLEPGMQTSTHIRDTGEILIPVYIPAKQIVGYELRTKRNVLADELKGFNNIDWAFYRIPIHESKNCVAVIDGFRNKNIRAEALSVSDNRIFYAESQAKLEPVPHIAKASTEKARVAALLCQNISSTTEPKAAVDVFMNHNTSCRSLPIEWITLFTALKIDVSRPATCL